MESTKTSAALIAVFALLCSPYAAAMKIKPGKWEFRSTTSMASPGGPREHVKTQCITDPTMTPDTLMQDMEQGCRLLESNSDGDSMSWKVNCANAGGEMTGVGNVTSSGDKLKGGMKMSMSFNGQDMHMDMTWDGTHLGACD